MVDGAFKSEVVRQQCTGGREVLLFECAVVLVDDVFRFHGCHTPKLNGRLAMQHVRNAEIVSRPAAPAAWQNAAAVWLTPAFRIGA